MTQILDSVNCQVKQTTLNKYYIHIHLKARPLHRGQPLSERLVIASRIITIYTNHVDKTQCIYLIFKLMNKMFFLVYYYIDNHSYISIHNLVWTL